MKIVIISGGFDPLHVGHTRYIRASKQMADMCVVIINNDNWLKKKKGFVFMPEDDRMEILQNLFTTHDALIISQHPEDCEDMSICSEIQKIHNAMKDTKDIHFILANGGDRTADNIPEKQLCEELGIEMVFNVGGEKIRSSSELVKQCPK